MTTSTRIFELRTYHAAPGKFAALQARFRDHTLGLFAKHGFTVVGFWSPLDAEGGSVEQLVYILAFDDLETAEKTWSAFRSDEEWISVKAESERDGPLTTAIESLYLEPTDYSPLT
jgi:hypothetical protein